MKHRRSGDGLSKIHIKLVTLVFLAMMVGLGALAWITKGAEHMPASTKKGAEHMAPPSPSSLAAPISRNAPLPSTN